MATRQEIINEARKWIGTPHIHQARLMGKGIDCVGLIACVFKTLGVLNYDQTQYGRGPTGVLPDILREQGFVEVSPDDRMPGDLGVFWFTNEKYPQHLALFTDIGILHSHQGVGKVVETSLTPAWKKHLSGVFRLPEVEPWQQ